MSYTSVGRNKVYASIQDLPENQKLVNGDRILIQTDDGTALIDYANVKIDLAHTTFETQVTNLIQFTSTAQTYFDLMTSEFQVIKEETTTMKNSVSELKEQMECCKLLFKFMMGLVDNQQDKTINMIVTNTLSGIGLAMFNECIDSIKAENPTFTFGELNLLA